VVTATTIEGPRRVRQSLRGGAVLLLPANGLSAKSAEHFNDYPRFPAKGRKTRSYDAFLRNQFGIAQPNSTTPLVQLRHTSPTKLPALQYAAVAKTVTNTPGYLTKQQRHKPQHSSRVGIKSRLLVTPLFRATQIEKQQKIEQRAPRVTPLRGIARALLRQALLARFVTRQIRDLRASATERRLKQRNTDPL